jgi:hypothetical protein
VKSVRDGLDQVADDLLDMFVDPEKLAEES